MSITIEKENYYVCVVDGPLPPGICPKGDFMGFLWKDNKTDGKWHFKYRFRYHQDDKVFHSADRKSWFEIVMRPDIAVPDISTDEAMALVNLIVSLFKEAGATLTIWPINGDGDKALDVMLDIPSFCVRQEEGLTEEQIRDKYERTDLS